MAQWQDDQDRSVSELHIILLSLMGDVFPVISGNRHILNLYHVYQETPCTGDRVRLLRNSSATTASIKYFNTTL